MTDDLDQVLPLHEHSWWATPESRPNTEIPPHNVTGSARSASVRTHLRRPRPDRHEPRPAGTELALVVCRCGDTFVVTKLDRLARSLPDAPDILAELTAKNVRLSMGGSIHDRSDPVGRLLFNVLAMVAEFESDLIRTRTREGM